MDRKGLHLEQTKFKNIQGSCKDKILEEMSREIQLPAINSKIKIRERLSLSHGDPGLIMFFSCMNEPQVVKLLQKRIINDLNTVDVDLSLFSGLSGIGFSFLYSQQFFDGSSQLVEQINHLMVSNIDKIISLSLKDPFNASSFDVIQGLSGIGQYLLSVQISGIDKDGSIASSLRLVLDALEKLSDLNRPGLNHWWISRENQFLKEEKELYSNGNYNLGMAHGVLGPVSLFLLVAKQNLLKKNDEKYLSMWVNELLSFERNVDGKIIFWPRESASDKEIYPGKEFINRNGWCYGESIICYVLFMAGDVLNSLYINNKAKIMLEQIVNAGNNELDSANLCHGKAGLLTILTQIKEKYYSSVSLDSQIKKLIGRILNTYSDDYKFGFIDTSKPIIPGYRIVNDKSGLLEGTVGILLAMADNLCKKQEVDIPWYSVFMLG